MLKNLMVTGLLVWGLVGTNLFGKQLLWDFEKDTGGFKTYGPGRISQSEQFVGSGRYALKFFYPKPKSGRAIFPALESKLLPIKDWSRFDRLMMPIYNDSDCEIVLCGFISDDVKRFRMGYYFKQTIPPHSISKLIFPLNSTMANCKLINQQNISIVHLFCANPQADVKLYFDDFTLLEKNEKTPDLPPNFDKIQVQQLKCKKQFYQSLIKTLPPNNFSVNSRRFWQKRVANFLKAFDQKQDYLVHHDSPSGYPLEWQSLLSIHKALKANPIEAQDFVLGFADSTSKVLPQVPVFQACPRKLTISMAKNESESFQLIVLPFAKMLKEVSVECDIFSTQQFEVSASPVGYVKTKFFPRYGSKHIGYWPDPILNFMKKTEIAPDIAQAFWVKIHAPENLQRGNYQGKINIKIAQKPVAVLPLEIKVHDFVLPRKSLLPLAVTFSPLDSRILRFSPETATIYKQTLMRPTLAWKKHRSEWIEFLSSFYLGIDSLYEYGEEPDFELLSKLKHENRLGMFNLGYMFKASVCSESDKNIQNNLKRISPRYNQAKKLGLLKHAYIYGADEDGANHFKNIEYAASVMKKHFPEVPILTTAYDHSYGTSGKLKSIDAFCPLTQKYNLTRAKKARELGKKVWWYICMSPTPPYANWFIESPALEARLLMGVLSYKYKTDGFLYYQSSLWSSNKNLVYSPWQTWPAESFPNYNGDGNLTYCGPDGSPVASIRLENFRDGLEDYAYLKLLEDKIRQVKDKSPSHPWLYIAQKTLNIPSTCVKSQTKFTSKFQDLAQWRQNIAISLETAPVK